MIYAIPLFWLGLIVAGVAGWILNIIALINMAGDITGLFVLRVVGIFLAPLGSILGLFV